MSTHDAPDAIMGGGIMGAARGDPATAASPRDIVEAGLVALAERRSGRLYRLDGVVVHGDHRGRELGFPTANLSFGPRAAVPADGIYAGRVLLLDAARPGLLGLAAISVGTNPTFDGRERRVEAHILDFDGNLYGRRIGVEFTRRLRGMLRFDGIRALIEQMHRDVEQVRGAGASQGIAVPRASAPQAAPHTARLGDDSHLVDRPDI
jgi:riboflavin kinase/FMN adenylyltransferase